MADGLSQSPKRQSRPESNPSVRQVVMMMSRGPILAPDLCRAIKAPATCRQYLAALKPEILSFACFPGAISNIPPVEWCGKTVGIIYSIVHSVITNCCSTSHGRHYFVTM